MNNRLLNRRQCVLEVLHPTRPSVSKIKLLNLLAILFKMDRRRIVIFGLRTPFGGGRSTGYLLLYDDEASQKRFEPKHRLIEVRDNKFLLISTTSCRTVVCLWSLSSWSRWRKTLGPDFGSTLRTMRRGYLRCFFCIFDLVQDVFFRCMPHKKSGARISGCPRESSVPYTMSVRLKLNNKCNCLYIQCDANGLIWALVTPAPLHLNTWRHHNQPVINTSNITTERSLNSYPWSMATFNSFQRVLEWVFNSHSISAHVKLHGRDKLEPPSWCPLSQSVYVDSRTRFLPGTSLLSMVIQSSGAATSSCKIT